MGCFSYICRECGKPINSTSFKGEGVKLFLLQDGKVIEEKQGDYDSYGGVFNSHEWKMDWGNVCDLIFDADKKNGIAAIHTDCWKGTIPIEQSEDDENQGWGKVKRNKAKETFHKTYN